MSMQTDVKAAHTEANALVASGRVRLKGYQCLAGGTAGDIIFTDGSASGVERLRFNVPANTNNPFANLIPGEGILFESGIYVTIASGAKVTVFYG